MWNLEKTEAKEQRKCGEKPSKTRREYQSKEFAFVWGKALKENMNFQMED